MTLAEFVAKQRSPMAFAWYGDASVWRVSHRPYEIARQAGLDPPAGKLVSITPALAAKVFAYVRSESLTHGRARFRESFHHECRGWIDEIGDGARFYSNSSYEGWFDGTEAWGRGFVPLTQFDIDAGVIGVSADGSAGFVFWVGANS
jgi:hypothetical protein